MTADDYRARRIREWAGKPQTARDATTIAAMVDALRAVERGRGMAEAHHDALEIAADWGDANSAALLARLAAEEVA